MAHGERIPILLYEFSFHSLPIEFREENVDMERLREFFFNAVVQMKIRFHSLIERLAGTESGFARVACATHRRSESATSAATKRFCFAAVLYQNSSHRGNPPGKLRWASPSTDALKTVSGNAVDDGKKGSRVTRCKGNLSKFAAIINEPPAISTSSSGINDAVIALYLRGIFG